ncbi:MAG TPA: hydroxyacylglutathione hydrolase [Alphaproteobacteria bacterium]|nr:hydroxyacylglutathione hydrolase [Alphaproteobacteria bacterium]
MSILEIALVPCLKDNYAYLLRDPATGAVGVVDPSEAAPVEAALSARGWTLTHILNTHHHWDHTGGNPALKAATGAVVVGPKADRERIPVIDVAVDEGETFMLGQAEARILFIPGHTRGHIAFWFPESKAVFCGDTLFAIGCGRTFEGTAAQMWHSLGKLKALPADTRVYCGHEYTQANARFALTVEPQNAALKSRARAVDAARAKGQPTIPSTIGEERATNPFFRADERSIAETIGLAGADAVAVFAEVRLRKDKF